MKRFAWLVLGASACSSPATHPPPLGAMADPNAPVPLVCDELHRPDAGLVFAKSGLLMVDEDAAACPVDGLICPLTGAPDPCDAGSNAVVSVSCDRGYWHEDCVAPSDAAAPSHD